MKILHTSDWHLGQRLFGESRENEHKEFLEWLLDTLNSKEFDALIVAGDIFDTATPPSYARRLYNDFLSEVAKSNCPNIVIIGGNHDSPVVLNEQQKLLKNLNIHIVGGFESDISKSIIKVEDKNGKLKGLILAVAYLRESDLRDSSRPTEFEKRAKELEKGISNYYHKIYEESKKVLKELALPNLPTVATGHLSTLKVIKSDGMRDIYIGSLEIFDKDKFPPFDYIALGHYHKFVSMKNICYSGSPIALSFDESSTQKVVLEVEVNSGSVNINKIKVPTFRHLYRLSGEIEELKMMISQIKPNSKLLPEWVELEIIPKDLKNTPQAIEEIRQISKDIKIVKSSIKKSSNVTGLSAVEAGVEHLKDLTPKSVFQNRLESEKDLAKSTKEKLMIEFEKVLEALEYEDTKS